MSIHAIPRNAVVLVCDGRRAEFLRNVGDATSPQLEVAQELDAGPNPRTSEQGSDRPGRVFERSGGGRSSVGQTDWHALDEERFLKTVATALDAMHADGELKDAFLVAPPKALGILRASLSSKVAENIRAELPKDLTKQSLPEVAHLILTA
jgi:protein required for attachment to host cells